MISSRGSLRPEWGFPKTRPPAHRIARWRLSGASGWRKANCWPIKPRRAEGSSVWRSRASALPSVGRPSPSCGGKYWPKGCGMMPLWDTSGGRDGITGSAQPRYPAPLKRDSLRWSISAAWPSDKSPGVWVRQKAECVFDEDYGDEQSRGRCFAGGPVHACPGRKPRGMEPLRARHMPRILYRGKPRCLQKRPRLKSQALLSENTCETNACSQPSSHRSAHYVHRRERKIAQVGPTILSENAL